MIDRYKKGCDFLIKRFNLGFNASIYDLVSSAAEHIELYDEMDAVKIMESEMASKAKIDTVEKPKLSKKGKEKCQTKPKSKK